MDVYLTRHGQTDLNKNKLMQGRVDIPLNSTGIAQAERAAGEVRGVAFDAVYASPLKRAVVTAQIISGFPEADVRIDERLIETDFGPYDGKPYMHLGLPMTLYWVLPEFFPAPAGVESIASMHNRVMSFLRELKKQDHENVLLVCHGGIMRVLSGCLAGAPKGMQWRPKPGNCEIRKYTI